VSDYIRTARASIRVPQEKRRELMERLEAAGMHDAAEDMRNRSGFAEARKPGVLDVLEVWLIQVEREAFGSELLRLREELQRDTAPPPT
jgi:hypothetical protein